MATVSIFYLVNTYFFCCNSRIKNMVTLLVFKLKAFKSKVSCVFFVDILDNDHCHFVLIVEFKCRCLSKSREISCLETE